MFSLLVGVLVSAAPVQVQPASRWVDTVPRAAHLLPFGAMVSNEEAENAPVEMLTYNQLLMEDDRLAHPPSLLPGILMVSIGGPAMALGAVGTWASITASNRAGGFSGLGYALLAVITIVITAAGLGVTIGGIVIIARKNAQQEDYAIRRGAVQQRLALMKSGAVAQPSEPMPNGSLTPSPEFTQREYQLRRLEETKPSLGLPITLMGVGAGVAAFTGYVWAVSGGGGVSTFSGAAIAIPITALVAGVALMGIGTIILIGRLNDRAEVDEQIRTLRDSQGPVAPPQQPGEPNVPTPPPFPTQVQLDQQRQQLPAPPVLLTYAWSF